MNNNNYCLVPLPIKGTNSEFTESCHGTAKKFEVTHRFKTKRKIGTPIHVKRSLTMITQFNSRRVGASTPDRLWKKTPPQLSPLAMAVE